VTAMNDPLLRALHEAGAATLALSTSPAQGQVLDDIERHVRAGSPGSVKIR
jgi:hypothetical protein